LAKSGDTPLKLTKNALRQEQHRLTLLNKYLPTLQLKKAMLQTVVAEARNEEERFSQEFQALKAKSDTFSSVLTDPISFSIQEAVKLKEVKKRYENIAGIDIPFLEFCEFHPFGYAFFDTPAWVDAAVTFLKKLKVAEIKIEIALEKIQALENELRDVSIRVNLFEKVLIPRARAAIKKIGVFLADQLLAGVSRAKVAKSKIYGAS
jgi:V/A-type H+/Na+-transporting ATPase subunit D